MQRLSLVLQFIQFQLHQLRDLSAQDHCVHQVLARLTHRQDTTEVNGFTHHYSQLLYNIGGGNKGYGDVPIPLEQKALKLISAAFEHFVLHVWEIYALEMRCFTLWSMGRTNHKFPIHTTWNVQMHLKSTVHGYCGIVRTE